ncbi:thioredoxin-like domain-containing protein [Bacteroides sp.]
MKKINILLILIICLTGCKKDVETTKITGEIKGLGNDTIYLYGVDGLYQHIDTIYVKGDKFSHSLKVDTITSAMLLLKKEVEYPIFIDKKNKIKIQGNANNLSYLNIDGNTYNEELSAFQASLQELGTPSDKTAETFIRQHNSSFVSIYLLDKYFVQKEKPDFKKIKELIDVMTGLLQDKPFIEQLTEYISQIEKVDKDKTAPFFSIPNAKGEKVTRTKQFKDKYLLINFWASWCEDCDRTNAELRKINTKYKKNKDFGILGISLDIDKEAWKNKIKQDTLSWEQVCTFTGWNMETAKQYAISKLPTNLLISPGGRILARDIPTDSISHQIEKVLEKNEKKKLP